MSTPLILNRDINGYVTYGLFFAEDKWGGYLSTNVEQHFTIPSNYKIWEIHFVFAPGSSVWVAYNQTAILPTGTFGPVNCELNPGCRRANAGSLISLITSDQTNDWAGATLYAIQ
jgi:hypothetical protein